ncbi:hypothetical protein CVT26_008694 [Gymnopilus dilepis]|uniref:DUF6533 domain-containing protein n=1 Tax=Gymnopilus dilepis TaxID=231916 RepID=A0A409W9R4_9AGAR|nr:hypothetical protein CVT26_008694 [Gymnopilus dilepis]
MSSSSPVGLAFTVETLSQIQISRSARLSSIAVVFFDYIITFDREVELIWKKKKSLPAILFLLNRYYALVAGILCSYVIDSLFLSAYSAQGVRHLLQDHELVEVDRALVLFACTRCQIYYTWEKWSALITCVLAEGILLMRVCALYHREDVIRRLAIGICVVSWLVAATIVGRVDVTGHILASAQGQLCMPTVDVGHDLDYLWIPVLVCDGLLFGLALLHWYQDLHFTNSRAFNIVDCHGLSDILVRDSVIYFLAIGAVYITCLIIWAIDANPLIEAPAGFSAMVSSTLGSRLIINLRERESNRLDKFTTSISSHSHS